MGHVKYSIDRVVQELHVSQLGFVPLFFLQGHGKRRRKTIIMKSCQQQCHGGAVVAHRSLKRNCVTRKVLEMAFHYLPLLFLLLQTHFDAVHGDLYIHLPLFDVLGFALVLWKTKINKSTTIN